MKGLFTRNRELANQGLKFCTKCREVKSLNEFEGRGSQCRLCKNEYNKMWQRKNPDKARNAKRRYRESHKDIATRLQQIGDYRRKAKKIGVPYNLDKEFLINLWSKQKGKCYFTRKKLLIFQNKGKPSDNSASLDRLIPDRGYIKGNVVWCSYKVNTAKGSLTEKQFIKFCKKIIDYRNKLDVATEN